MLCHCIRLVDCLIVLSVLEVQLTVDHVMTFGLTDGMPGSLVVIHVERAIFNQVIPVLLENVAK